MPNSGQFISFEGSEGAGKTTQIALLQDWLKAKKLKVITLREPGATKLGEAVRNLLKHDPAGEGMCPESELLLFCASRAQLVREVIQPALASGTWVIADRFHDSTTVYQGYARGLPLKLVETINDFALSSTIPDLTLYLDLDTQTSLARAQQRTGPKDRMEQEPSEFFSKVRQGYLNLFKEQGNRFRMIQAVGSKQEIFNLILKEIKSAFPDIRY